MSRFQIHFGNPVPQRFRGYRPRTLFVVALFTVAALILVWRAFDLQILQYDHLSRLRERQSQRILRIKGRRGPIYDREVSQRLAGNLGHAFTSNQRIDI